MKNYLKIDFEIFQDKRLNATDIILLYYFSSFDEAEKFLLINCVSGDLLITMGAGNVVKIGEDLLGQ